MKKTILFSIMMFFASISFSQSKTVTILTGNSYYDVAMVAADTISANQTVYNLTFNAPQNYPTTQDFYTKLTNVSGAAATVQLQGSKFSDVAYVNIGSAITWSGSTADTVIVISNATENRYRFYKVVYTSTAGKALIYDAILKLYFE